MSANRRDFIKFVVAGAVTAGCPIDLSLVAAQAADAQKDHPADVDGEDNRICHQVRDGKVFTRPPASARHDVVIVGGGVSGLAAAYRLQHRDFLLLEKEPHWGGNAYAMEYEGSMYATGSAFLTKDEHAYPFSKEIGLEPLPVNSPDGSIIRGEFVADTWGNGLNKLPYPASVREGFEKFKKEMLAIDVEKRSKELFGKPFSDFLKAYPPELKQWWDNYGPSNWGAASEDTAAGLAILSLQEMVEESDVDNRYTWPGGLGAVTRKLADILQPRYKDRMQTGATTVAVVSEKENVQVTYMLGGELKTVAAKAVIMATPKFITRRIVEGLPEKQSEAMRQIRYIPYPVVNLIFDQPVFNHGYDTWCPGNTFTDFIVADWVVQKQPGYKQKFNIVSCYTPMKDEERSHLLPETGARKVAADVLSDFQKLLPGLNVDPVEVHIYRRGHPMYMSKPGLYTEVQPLVRRPMDRVFFANTDSEGPESTTDSGILAAQRAVKEVEARLAGRPMPKQKAVAG
ncbi:MAG TPA: FAD-dependent oxidoreductase [Candidatus Eremiobacteraceae bacterium]|nr:FAD-dependent oxidoreductase [Candidatus Eremiobacteraceae bacterium]